MAASQGHAVFTMGPDLQGERNHRVEWEPEVRQLFPGVAKDLMKENWPLKNKTPKCISLEGAAGPHMHLECPAKPLNTQQDAGLYTQ